MGFSNDLIALLLNAHCEIQPFDYYDFLLKIDVLNFSLNLEIKDKKGRTPLWLALTVPDEKINPDDEDSVAARLSQAGASPDSIETSSGEEYDISFILVHTIILCSFVYYSLRISLPTLHFFILIHFLLGDSLLHLAATQSRQNSGLFLAGHGAEPNVTNKLGETPLHGACRSGLINLVSKLLHW